MLSWIKVPYNLFSEFFFDFWCFNATFNNISAMSWRPVLVVEEADVPEKTSNHGEATSTLYQGADPGVGAHPARSSLKLEQILFVCVKSWFFTGNTPKFSRLALLGAIILSARPLTWNPGSTPDKRLSKWQTFNIFVPLDLKVTRDTRLILNNKYTSGYVRLSEWCCSVSMVWVQISSREEQQFESFKI